MRIKSKGRPKSALRKYVFGNLTAKLMALAMAVALWVYANQLSHSKPTPMEVQVRVTTSEGWTVARPRAGRTTVLADLTYPRRSEKEVQQAVADGRVRIELTAEPDEDRPDDQTTTLSLDDAEIVAPENLAVAVSGFDPPRLDVRLVREGSNSLPVGLRVSAPPQGYEVRFMTATPTRVVVTGPKDIVDRAEKIETAEEIDITGTPPLSEWEWTPTVRLASYVVVDGEQHPVSCSVEFVEVRIKIELVSKKKTFTKVPIDLLIPPDYKYAATISRGAEEADVTLSGPGDVLESVEKKDVKLFVDLRDLVPRDLPYPQEVRHHVVDTLGANRLTVDVKPFTCSVKVEEKPAE